MFARKIFFMCLVFSALFLMSSCGKKEDPTEEPEESKPTQVETLKLSTPSGIEIDSNLQMIIWNQVEHATKYIVQVNDDNPVDVGTSHQMSLEDFQIEASYSVEVKAIGNGTNYLDSDWSEAFEVFIEAPIESKLSDAHFLLTEDTWVYKVSNATESFDFDSVLDISSTWIVSSNASGESPYAEKMITLSEGDNLVYLIVDHSDETEVIMINIRRNEMYQVSFDTLGGSEVDALSVEEDHLVVEPQNIPNKYGYNFMGWDFNFNSPITSDMVISALWEKVVPVTLATPSGLMINKENNVITWNQDEHAAKYLVQVNDGNPVEFSSSSYMSLISFQYEVAYTVKVQAIGDQVYYADSEWSEALEVFIEAPVELKLTEAGFQLNNDTWVFKVSNFISGFGFNGMLQILSPWFVSSDASGETPYAENMIPLSEGDNMVYLIVDRGDETEVVSLNIRRREYFMVRFDSLGGAPVDHQMVEEDQLAVEPEVTQEKLGFDFIGWDFDFNTPITNHQVINAIWEHTTVNYIDENGETKSIKDELNHLTSLTDTTLSTGWYLIYGSYVTDQIELNIFGDVHVILKDESNWDFNGSSIKITENSTLYIYSQSLTFQWGRISNIYHLGGTNEGSGGNLVINGGSVQSSNIGSSSLYANGGNITINGGDITTTYLGNNHGGDTKDIATTGTGVQGAAGGNITINGGFIIATIVGNNFGGKGGTGVCEATENPTGGNGGIGGTGGSIIINDGYVNTSAIGGNTGGTGGNDACGSIENLSGAKGGTGGILQIFGGEVNASSYISSGDGGMGGTGVIAANAAGGMGGLLYILGGTISTPLLLSGEGGNGGFDGAGGDGGLIRISRGLLNVTTISAGSGGMGDSGDLNGQNGGTGGDVVIDGGKINAVSITSGNGGAGGTRPSDKTGHGGNGGNSGIINIKGGTTNSTNTIKVGTQGVAGKSTLGANGSNGRRRYIQIEGGNVFTNSMNTFDRIIILGGNVKGNPLISVTKGPDMNYKGLSMHVVETHTPNMAIESLSIPSVSEYMFNDMTTDENGKLYLWIEVSNSTSVEVIVNSNSYHTKKNS